MKKSSLMIFLAFSLIIIEGCGTNSEERMIDVFQHGFYASVPTDRILSLIIGYCVTAIIMLGGYALVHNQKHSYSDRKFKIKDWAKVLCLILTGCTLVTGIFIGFNSVYFTRLQSGVIIILVLIAMLC